MWELMRCRELCFDPRSAMSVRVVKGEKFTTGYSESKLTVAIDLGQMVDRLGHEIGYHRQQRFEDWVAGHPVQRLGQVEQIQLKADVRRAEELVIGGGYRFMLTRCDASGS
jgi:hypothetical protein